MTGVLLSLVAVSRKPVGAAFRQRKDAPSQKRRNLLCLPQCSCYVLSFIEAASTRGRQARKNPWTTTSALRRRPTIFGKAARQSRVSARLRMERCGPKADAASSQASERTKKFWPVSSQTLEK